MKYRFHSKLTLLLQAIARRAWFTSMRSRLTIAFALVALVGVSLISVYGYQAAQDYTHQGIKARYITRNHISAHAIEGILREVESDLRTTVGDPAVQGIIRAREGDGTDAESVMSYAMWIEYLGERFEVIAQSYGRYAQLRYLDENGNEVVRVDYDGTRTRRMPQSELQNKTGRYYFQEAMQLPPGQIYISRLDLNQERGQIQIPYLPMVRYAMPVFNQQGERRGIVVFNVMAEKIIQDYAVHSAEEGVFVFVADANGYYTHHSAQPEKEFGGPGDLNTGQGLRADFPEVADRILSGQPGEAYTTELEIFYAPIQTLSGGGDFWVLGLAVPRSIVEAPMRQSTWLFAGVLALSLLLAGGAGSLAARRIVGPLEALRRGARQIAEGNLNQRVQVRGGVEVTELAKAFNQMAESLQRQEIERKRGEEALRGSEAKFKGFVEFAPDATVIVNKEGEIILANTQTEKSFGYASEELVGKTIETLIPQRFRQSHAGHCTNFFAHPRARAMGTSLELLGLRKDGSEFPVDVNLSYHGTGADVIVLAAIRDITERKRAEEQIERQIQHLSALRTIDNAIAGSLDLRLTLNVALEQIVAQLGVDAADVLLLNPYTQTLEYASGRGFRSKAIERSRLRLGEGHVGRAALERQTVHVPDLSAVIKDFVRAELLSAEDFVTFTGVPLIAKGEVKGVLEVFHRTSFNAGTEWLEFIETLAEQVAIAIDSAQLFTSLQRSNVDLVMAYDATIEGWSRALDLRDEETEGHTQRVTELTLQLARAMGTFGESELVHVRRGALLHDIGKMGIPDSILLKPGPLTDEEWVIMRKHPQYAFEMLSPIAYLRPALDIPDCHHEKWDGSGYPRGLKGEQIPLAARIFAVIDVYDALTSDRLYRKAWSKAKVLEHIRAGSGSHFDPQVVEAFLRMVGG